MNHDVRCFDVDGTAGLDVDEKAARIEASLGLVLGTQAGESTWCFCNGRLAPGEFAYVFPCMSIVVAEDRHGASRHGYRIGGIVWDAAEDLARWMCSTEAEATVRRPWASFDSALELGAGIGLVAVMLGLLGLPNVLATDGDASLCELASANAARNGLAEQVRGTQLRWGCDGDLDATLQGLGGRCSPLVVAAEVLYAQENTPHSADALEQTLRSLIGRGGCRLVVLCWRVRYGNEESFLPRLSDLGTVRTVWRSEDGEAPPDGKAWGSKEMDRWVERNMGTRAISVLWPEVASERGELVA